MTDGSAPNAFLFDWDNTLVDSWGVIHAALRETFIAMGQRPWTMEEVRRNVRASARDAFPQLFGDRAQEAIDIFYRAFEAQHLDALRPLPNAEACVRALHAEGHYLGVVSNKRGSLLRKELDHLGWSGLFGAAIGATDAARDKPALDPVLMALEPGGLKPSAAVWFVGDADIDMVCAHNSGCTAVLVAKEAPVADEFHSDAPDRHFGDLAALLAALSITT